MLNCDLSHENVQQQFSVELLKPLATRWVPVGGVDESVEGIGKAVGFFLSALKALKKAVGKYLPNRWKYWKKPLGSFPLPVKSAEKSRWENSSYPLLQRRKLTYLRFRLGVCNQSSVTSRTKKYEVQFSDGTEEGERNLTVYNLATPNRKKKITVVWTKSDLKNEKRKSAKENRDTTTSNK